MAREPWLKPLFWWGDFSWAWKAHAFTEERTVGGPARRMPERNRDCGRAGGMDVITPRICAGHGMPCPYEISADGGERDGWAAQRAQDDRRA